MRSSSASPVMSSSVLGSSGSLASQMKVSNRKSTRNVSQAVEQDQKNQC